MADRLASVRIAITGSSGLIGSALIRSLETDGHTVIRILRTQGGAGTLRWDIAAGHIDHEGLEDLDAVVHLAGEGIAERRWSDEQKRKILESRTQGTALLANALAALTHKPPVLLCGSAIGFYGNRGDEQLQETSARGSGFLAEVVVAWEAAAAPAEAAGIRTPRLRTGIVLDAHGGVLGRIGPLAKLGLLGKLGDGKQWMSWISLHDEVRAIRFLLEADVTGPVNLTAPTPVTNATFTKAVGSVLHRPTLLPIPRFGPKLLLGPELADALLFEGQRVFPQVLQEAGFPFDHPEIDGTLRSIFTR